MLPQRDKVLLIELCEGLLLLGRALLAGHLGAPTVEDARINNPKGVLGRYGDRLIERANRGFLVILIGRYIRGVDIVARSSQPGKLSASSYVGDERFFLECKFRFWEARGLDRGQLSSLHV